MKKLQNKTILLILFFLAIGLFITAPLFLIPDKPPFQTIQFWAHKGCGKYNAYNSENFFNAYEKGFRGIELDVIYHNYQIFVQHDIQTAHNPLPLKQLMNDLDTLNFKYWIDLKSGFNQYEEGIHKLIECLEQFPHLKFNTFVETDNLKHLRLLKKHNIKTAFRTRLYKKGILNQLISLLKNNIAIIIFRPSALAMPLGELKKKQTKNFKNQSIITWHKQSLSEDCLMEYSTKFPNIIIILLKCDSEE